MRLHEPTSQLSQLFNVARKIRAAELSEATISGYRADWSMFSNWCSKINHTNLPASSETVMLYITAMLDAGRKVSTLWRHVAAIRRRHYDANSPNPCTDQVREFLDLAQRDRCERPRQMRPLSVEQLLSISRSLKARATWRSFRDRALLVLGFATALRRNSLVKLALSDVEIVAKGVLISVRKEKQNKTGDERLIAVPVGTNPDTCASGCLKDWLDRRGAPAHGALFTRWPGTPIALGGDRVREIIRREVSLLGLDPRDRWAGHSLRAGFVTAAGEENCGELLIGNHTGQSPVTVRRYFRRTALWRNNVAGMIGL